MCLCIYSKSFVFATQLSASGADTLQGSMWTPVECVCCMCVCVNVCVCVCLCVCVHICLALEFVCSDDGRVLYVPHVCPVESQGYVVCFCV